MRDAAQKGLQYIADSRCKSGRGLHPQAHLWDNGADAATELKAVMKIRAKALAQFGEKNIRTGQPMAMLEDVLVPVYLYHRYQAEAATKVVGGMYYHLCAAWRWTNCYTACQLKLNSRKHLMQ